LLRLAAVASQGAPQRRGIELEFAGEHDLQTQRVVLDLGIDEGLARAGLRE
jgi:hypothetical protein